VVAFDGGRMTSHAGAMLLGATDGQLQLIERFAGCFTDYRAAELVEHTVSSLVGQRVFGIALGYEDLIDHEQMRHDPTLAVVAGKLAARRKDYAPLAGKSMLNRLERGGLDLTRYHRIAWDEAKIETSFGLSLSTRRRPRLNKPRRRAPNETETSIRCRTGPRAPERKEIEAAALPIGNPVTAILQCQQES